MECPPFSDNGFGPQYCDKFDFTLVFEQSLFQIAPCALLLLVIPLRASRLRRQEAKCARSWTHYGKQAIILSLALSQCALLISSALSKDTSRTGLAAAGLSFLTCLALFWLSSIEHMRSVNPSDIINVFVLISIILDVPQARTLWLRHRSDTAVATTFTICLAIKMVVLFLESKSKRPWLLTPYRANSREALTNIFDRTVLWWLGPLFLLAYRKNLRFEDLYAIDDSLLSGSVERRFMQHWSHLRRYRSEKRPLLRAMVLTTKWSLVAIILPRLCLSAVKLTQPLLVGRITSWLGEDPRDDDTGRGLIAATTLIYLVMALLTVAHKRQTDRFLTTLRGVLVSGLHSQSLAGSRTQLADGNMLTLVSTDVLRISMSLQRIGEIFAAPFEVIGVAALLANQSGVSCVAPIAVGIIVPIMSALNTKRGLPLQRLWLDAIQQRIAYTSAVLGCSKGFKMLGLTEFLSEQIQRLRVKELADYAGYRKFVAARETLASAPRALGPTLGLMVFTLINGGDKLTPSLAFSILSLLSLLSAPIEEVVWAIIDLQLAYASVLQIQSFLLGDGSENSMPSLDSNNASPSIEMAARTPHGVSLTNATIYAGSNPQRPVLQDISLDLQKGSFTLVLGPVGSGKSSLLRAVMADMKLDAGSRSVSKDFYAFAFCSQEPWLPNDSIRSIIVGHSEYDSVWYTTVVHACALSIDIARLPAGEQTTVGDKGMSLSGGQKQRLALARALYSRIPMLVLDDIFSGLDVGSLRHIVKNVFGHSGIARRLRLTIIMATQYGAHVVQQVDQIAILGHDGRIVEQGLYQTLVSNRNSFLHTIELREENSPGDLPEETNDPIVTLTGPVGEPDEISEPVSARRTGQLSTYAYWIRSFGLKLSVLFLVATLFAGFSWKFMDVWVQWWSDAAASPSGASRHSLGYWIGWHIAFALLALMFDFAKFWTILVWAVPHSSAQVHQQILNSVMNAPYWFFVKTNLGSIVNRFSSDLTLIESAGAGPILQASETFTMVLGSAALILAGSSYASATLPFLLVTVYLLQRFYLRTSRQLRHMDLETQAPLINAIQESMYGVSIIRAFGWESASHQKFLDILDRSQRPYYLLLCIQRWLSLMLDILTAIIATVVVSLAIGIPSTSSASSLGLALLNVLGFNSRLSAFVVAWTTIETSASAVSRCQTFEQTTPDERLPLEIAEPDQNWPGEGRIVIQDLRAAYTPDGPDVLHGIDLRIAPGAKIGICGRSGSGKSSFLLSLFRMLENIPQGSISIDDVDLATLPRSALRERLTAIPQETLIIPGSLRENIDPLRTSHIDDINSALDKVGLALLVADRGGIEKDMADIGLSQGELQLFAVARALLRPSKVLVVDEMTSSMDHLSEKKILGLVRTEFEGSTVLAVAHRLATIVDFDMVLVLDTGRVLESGNPRELLQRTDGHFKKMWDQQESQGRQLLPDSYSASAHENHHRRGDGCYVSCADSSQLNDPGHYHLLEYRVTSCFRN